jgi:streptogramin lyase
MEVLEMPWVLAIAILAAWAFFTIGIDSSPDWDCSPVDPMSNKLPEKSCFRAILSDENNVNLQWRVKNSRGPVYIYADTGPNYNDIGFQPAVCDSAQGGTCSISFRVQNGGYFRWLLRVKSGSHHRVHVPASISVPWPFPPTELTGGGFVDVLAPTSRTFSWTADQRNAWADQDIQSAWIELLPPGSHAWEPTHYSRSGEDASFTVPQSVLSNAGDVAYGIRDCHYPPGSDRKYCSKRANVLFYVGSDQFLGQSVIYAESGHDMQLAFTDQSGDIRILASPTLTPARDGLAIVATPGSTHSIDSTLLTPGVHRIGLASCLLNTRKCSNQKQVERTNTAHSVEAGDTFAHVITAFSDEVYIVVDSPVEWDIGREYTEDFYPAVAHTILGRGEPLDITYDNNAGIWLINEFSNSIEHVSPTGKIESYTIPLARQFHSRDSPSPASKPFALSLYGEQIGPSSISMLAERATRAGHRLWFTQGGGMLPDLGLQIMNHSRVISYDPSLNDSPATPYDDRLCVYNIPADDENSVGNNQVIGLAATSDRIWVGESRGIFGLAPSVISSFVANPKSCDNLLVFENPDALANQALQYCGSFSTPEQDGCIEKFSLQDLPSGIKVAHLENDPVDDSIWFTDAHGKYLGNLNPDRAEVFELYKLPDTHSTPAEGKPMFGGFPWNLKVDKGAVYLAEYATQHIIRFDKATSSFDEILIPSVSSRVRLHSIAIDATTDRLWFTLANEARIPLHPASSTIGYIDLGSWRSYIAKPKDSEGIPAVIYSGLDKIKAPAAFTGQHQAFRGIAVDPASGKIALATMWRGQITELTPFPGFRP